MRIPKTKEELAKEAELRKLASAEQKPDVNLKRPLAETLESDLLQMPGQQNEEEDVDIL